MLKKNNGTGTKPLLTIGIPTYNRGDLLANSLLCVINAVRGLENFIELIISDNCSDDNTEEVVKSFQNSFPLQYFKNERNIGFNYNYNKIVDCYASGEYCWIIGDDDFVGEETVKMIISVLQSQKSLSFLYLNYELVPIDLLLKKSEFNVPDAEKMEFKSYETYSSLLSDIADDGNIFMGFISAVIFRLALIKEIDKTYVSDDTWTTPFNLFPHSSYYAIGLKDEPAGAIKNTMFAAAVLEKPWSSKISLLYLKLLPEMYNYYLDKGFSHHALRKHKELMVKTGLSYLLKSPLSAQSGSLKYNFLRKFVFDGTFYKLILQSVLEKLR